MEVWKPVADGYEVSSLGNVRSSKRGRVRLLSPMVVAGGYSQIQLRIDKQSKKFLVHRLVAEAFIPNPENKPIVNHIDGNKHNNRVDNLEWVTQAENMRHAVKSGLIKQGADSADAILTKKQVEWIRSVFVPRDTNFSAAALSRKFGVSKEVIARVVHGERYKNASGKIHGNYNDRVPASVCAEIRRLYKKGVRGCGSVVLARKFGLSKKVVLRILHETD